MDSITFLLQFLCKDVFLPMVENAYAVTIFPIYERIFFYYLTRYISTFVHM